MRPTLRECICTALTAALASTVATFAAAAPAVEPAEETVILPNAADPKPGITSSQGLTQVVVVSLGRRPESARKSQAQKQKAVAPPGELGVRSMPFHRPKPN